MKADDQYAATACRTGAPQVHVVDDDEDLRQSLVFLLGSVGIEPHLHHDASGFLEQLDPGQPAVLVLDVRMPGMSGLQLQEQLLARGYPAPIIFCSAHGDIPMSVRALRQGAVTFLEKPYEPQQMLDLVQEQVGRARELFAERALRCEVEDRLDQLTPREREVLRLVVDGLSSQMIARRLGASVKTVDVHRARIKAKTDAESLGTLVSEVLRTGVPI
ncbi:response regulator transcription factor [Nocardioides kongjuensis]|uniref:RNA polymerase sigma factor (Sigma-70 family) n=1 Tax=Nocardioides kongjuensis TaxID=349522 RepID=A0A852R880_9ACTN|nr:response regulator [Nocardioides kongjuensis]NYD31103.1 RNA polymerase sigma factor (sigma-70 family) [Nocardioides kongjuensis]